MEQLNEAQIEFIVGRSYLDNLFCVINDRKEKKFNNLRKIGSDQEMSEPGLCTV